MEEKELLPVEWQPIFDEVGYDIMDIVMDFQHGRKSAGETMDRISDFALAAYRHGSDLESAVISAAINFRKAEVAAWQKSEVGTDEEAVEAKREKSRAYLALVNATAALMDEREGHG